MVSGLDSSYQVLCLSSIEADRFKASTNPYRMGSHIDIPFSSLKLYNPRLEVSDFQVGDYIKVKVSLRLPSRERQMVSKPVFTSVNFNISSNKLNILTAGYIPANIPLSSLGDLSNRLPHEGRIKIFNRNGEIIMIKVGPQIVNLKKVVKKVFYITEITEREITICDKIDYTGQYNIIEISALKNYNKGWNISDLELKDRIEVKYDSGYKPLSYKLLLSPTQVAKYGDTYQFNISEFGMKAMTASQLGDAAAYLSSGMTSLKVLHTSGNIRAFMHNRDVIRVTKPKFSYYPAKPRPEEIKKPRAEANAKVLDEPAFPRNVPLKQHASLHNLEPKNLQQVQSYNKRKFSSDSSQNSVSSYKSESFASSLNPSYTLSRESNQRIPIEQIREDLQIQDVKFNVLSSVFSSARLFNNEKYGYLKAIGVGYLDHLCRQSTQPDVLNQFITDLRSNSGLYKLSLQTNESRNFLILMLEHLALERSIYSLEDYYIHPDFMEAYIKELHNIIYNKLIESNVNPNLLDSFQNNTTAFKTIREYIGNALGLNIFTHSTFDIKPRPSSCGDYSLVINLILITKHHQACLLYYKYQDQEDTNKPTNRDHYRCKICRLLPHESYFSKIDVNICQKCFFSGKNGKSIHLNERSPQHRVDNSQFNQVLQTQVPTHECEGCKETTPACQLKKQCDHNHILCEKCVIISQRKRICILCDSLAVKHNSHHRPQISIQLCPRCNQVKPIEFLKCKHFFCSDCLQDHINARIVRTPLNTHIRAGVVNITCPSPRCEKLISSKTFYGKILPANMDTYNDIISRLPKENCSKCNQPKLLPHLQDLTCHKICRHCVLEYFDEKLDRGISNFECMLGCHHSFNVRELNKIMKPKQFVKYYQIVTGSGMRDQEIRCPGCRKVYKNVQFYEKFKCKHCNSEFCGVCVKASTINGKYQGGGHQPSCIFFQQ